MPRKLKLYKICLRYVKNNPREILMVYQERNVDFTMLFCGLPPMVCEDLMVPPPYHNPLFTYCIHRIGIKRLYLSFLLYDLPFLRMESVCKKITFAHITFANLSEEDLRTLINHMPNIIELNLRNTNTTDKILENIGENCHFLKFLNVSSCSITDFGLFSLFYDANKACRCKQLEYLRIDDTQVTWKGLITVLNTHNLRLLDASKNVLYTTLNRYSCYYFDRILHLENLNLSRFFQEEPLKIFDILLCTPYLKELHLREVNINDEELLTLPKLNYLENLSIISRNNNLTFEVGIVQFLSLSGKNLKRLELHNIKYVNMYFIGKYCINLETIYLFSIFHLYFRSVSADNKPIFRSLKSFTCNILEWEPWDDFFYLVFKNAPSLENIRINGINFKDYSLKSIIFLPVTLKKIYFINCESVTKALIYQIFDHLPNLRVFRLQERKHSLSVDDLKEIFNHLHDVNSSMWFECCGRFRVTSR
ncbi:uncharacterized protein LOC111624111 isoform X1 [Centruroides sculpturatus]|uniref:uncharacterized protein LOC111624111 isoform X1 n=1 Tax=Centruroides sculpturatus TaxID=218467 RepID=UPI000C6DD795|nr:uncharacterized protein LOC111624111 isoform X1 [Centruroides sculpturatus]